MSTTTLIKTNFTAGEVSPDLLGRGDLRAYENGALSLRNVFIQPTGGVTRRAGLRYIDTALGAGRLIAFEFNTEQTYLLVVTHLMISVYAQGILETQIAAPWAEADIAQLAWTQSADTLLLTHPAYPPKKLLRDDGSIWSIADWEYFTAASGRLQQPMYKFAPAATTLTPSGTSGTITLTASSNVFDPLHAGTRLRLINKEVQIISVLSPTVVSASVIETLTSASTTVDWEEQAFSPVRGYPVTVVFHQDRLVIGGSRDLPNRMWFSQSGDLFNFDLGSGLDSESIEFGIFSDQVNAIRGVFSGRHLQVFTSGAEWMVTGDPLTPANVQIKRQTRVGSATARYIPPLDVDGATLFVARNGQELREFIYTDVEQAYRSTDLALLSHHMITTPVDQDFDQRKRLLYLVRDNGQFATLTVYRAEAVAAWTLHSTDGDALSVCVVGDEVYVLIRRGSAVFIELIDDGLYVDAALAGSSATPITVWGGLDHLEGQSVTLLADGAVVPSQIVISGQITLTDGARTLQAGLPFAHIIEPLPPAITGPIGGASAVRLVALTLRLNGTAAVRADLGRGLQPLPLRQLGEDAILDAPAPLVSGDIRIKAFGWASDLSLPLWRIEQSDPLPFTLIAAVMQVTANG